MRPNSHVVDDGGEGAVVVVEFLDFECEACGAFHPIVEDPQDCAAGHFPARVEHATKALHFNEDRTRSHHEPSSGARAPHGTAAMTADPKKTPSPPGASFFRGSAPPKPQVGLGAAQARVGGSKPPPAKPDQGSGDVQPGALQISAFNCRALAEAEPHALGLTYEFNAAPEGDPYAVTVTFEGQRAGVTHRPGPGDRFQVSTTVKPVLPGVGRVAVTTRVPGLAAGSWRVVARPSAHHLGLDEGPSNGLRAALPHLPGGRAQGSTGWAPVIAQRAPGVFLGSWAALVGLGAVVGLSLQAMLAAFLGLSVFGVALVSVIASLIGLIGAKVYYLAVYPAARRRALIGGGMCIQGFVIGAGAGLIIGAWVAGIPIGTLLDITAPALMFGMTIGRFGCFFSGCCVGRPTASRWGLWSSDRRVGVRRIPTQLLESAVAAAIGVAALALLIILGSPPLGGVIFIGTLAAYVAGRQLLLPLRAERGKTRHGRAITLAAAAIILAADVAAAIVMYAR